MPTLRDIKRKIAAVKKTQQITKAMNMVAAAKLRGAQQQMENFRPYAAKFAELMESLSRRTDPALHPLLIHRPVQRVELILITADRGLCGSFNTNLITTAERLIRQKRAQNLEVSLTCVGRKGRDYFRRRRERETIRNQYLNIRTVDFQLASKIGESLMGHYLEEACDEAYLIYSRFINVAVQRPVVSRLLPLTPEGEGRKEDMRARGSEIEYIYEPSPDILLGKILPEQLKVQIFRALLESQASEHAARMTAMDNATKNCKEMIDHLTLVFNKARQAAITKELMDIVGGAEALKG